MWQREKQGCDRDKALESKASSEKAGTENEDVVGVSGRDRDTDVTGACEAKRRDYSGKVSQGRRLAGQKRGRDRCDRQGSVK